MSMSVLSALQCLEAFFCYLLMTVIVPAAVFGKKFRKLDLNQKFMAYFTIGNFYMINIVFLLELLHISNRFTLIIFTVIPALVVFSKSRNISIKLKITNAWKTFNRLISGQLGIKTALNKFGRYVLKLFKKLLVKIKEIFVFNITDWIILAAFGIVFVKIYTSNIVTTFGYTASDIPVHNYWINYLSKNQIFVAGIYPFGFHCVIYYMHEIFRIDTYVLLRIFCVVQKFFVDMMLLSLLKYCCKTKYTPYIGLFLYSIADLYLINTYSRFYSTLPQEFGMIFIYPCVYFAFAFFKERKSEVCREKKLFGETKEVKKKIKQQKKEIKNLTKQERKTYKKKYFKLRVKECASTWYLAGFAMSFSMTLAVHFYGTMIAGLFCVGIAAGFFFRFIRPKYFSRVILTFVISMVIAILPMAVAFAQGIPLQGSLGWGMNVLTGKDTQNDEEEAGTTVDNAVVSGDGIDVSDGGVYVSGDSAQVSDSSVYVSGDSAQVSDSSAQVVSYEGATAIVSGDTVYYMQQNVSGTGVILFDKDAIKDTKGFLNDGNLILNTPGLHSLYDMDNLDYKRPLSFYINLLKKDPSLFKDKMLFVAGNFVDDVVGATKEFVFESFSEKEIIYFYIAVVILLLAGLIMFVFRQYDYGASIISIAVFCMCIALLLAAGRLGLPTLMDGSRCSIYFAYMVPLIAAMLVDIIIFAVSGWAKWKYTRWIKHMLSLVCLCVTVIFMYKHGLIKEPYHTGSFEPNEAVTCLTNIINEEKDFTWTICSANDETRMGEDHGYHYEIIEFLRRMEGMGGNAMLTIPTDSVYFFIEKVPIDYASSYEDSGQRISEKGAYNYLPSGDGLGVYQKKNRWIVMSRMYYWAQEFKKLYPNELKVYMETDDFVCYKLTQNTYRLYNLAIDYGYNTDIYDFGNQK